MSALKIIVDKGPGALSIRAAAESAVPPMSYEAPRRYFKSAEAVLAFLAEEGFKELGRRFSAVQAKCADPQERLLELGVAYVEFAAKFKGHFRVMLDLRHKTKRLQQIRREAIKHLEDCVVALNPQVGSEGRRGLMATCWAIVHGLSALHNDNGFMDLGITSDVTVATRRALTGQVLTILGVGLWGYAGYAATEGEPPV